MRQRLGAHVRRNPAQGQIRRRRHRPLRGADDVFGRGGAVCGGGGAAVCHEHRHGGAVWQCNGDVSRQVWVDLHTRKVSDSLAHSDYELFESYVIL